MSTHSQCTIEGRQAYRIKPEEFHIFLNETFDNINCDFNNFKVSFVDKNIKVEEEYILFEDDYKPFLNNWKDKLVELKTLMSLDFLKSLHA